MTGRARLGWALVAAAAALGCTKLLPNRCDVPSDCGPNFTCDMQMKTCIANGGAGGAAGTAGAGGEAGAAGSKSGAAGSMAGAGGAAGSKGGAGGKAFSCSQCKGATPICEVDAGACVSCGKLSGSCGSPAGGTPLCVPDDGGTKAGMCVACLGNKDCTGTAPICELGGDAGASRNTCRACTSTADCTQLSSATPVCVTATNSAGGAQPGTCVGCVANSDCTVGTKPICELTTTNGGTSVNTCRACTKDAECGGPGVCMDDGHCAKDTEVMLVDATANCPGSGTTATPYCSLAAAAPHLAATPVMIILGGTNDQLTVATSGVTPVILGRKNAAGDIGSIPALAASTVTVNSDKVLIRDLTVNFGSGTASKGIVVSGAGTSLSLRRVTVSLGTKGLGIDAESGATLAMDECYVQNNPVGGILVNGATANIQNTVIASNPSASGYGIQFNAPGSGTQFVFNTIVGYATAAISDLNHQVTLSDSIVLGPTTNCVTDTSVITMQGWTFSTTSPYHLTGHLPCPVTPTSSPDHDIDGDPRTSTNLDCGADQLVP